MSLLEEASFSFILDLMEDSDNCVVYYTAGYVAVLPVMLRWSVHFNQPRVSVEKYKETSDMD